MSAYQRFGTNDLVWSLSAATGAFPSVPFVIRIGGDSRLSEI